MLSCLPYIPDMPGAEDVLHGVDVGDCGARRAPPSVPGFPAQVANVLHKACCNGAVKGLEGLLLVKGPVPDDEASAGLVSILMREWGKHASEVGRGLGSEDGPIDH